MVSAQPKAAIRGTVRDAQTKAPVPFASVFLGNSTIGVSAGDSGTYVLEQVPPGKYQLIASSLGYLKKSLQVRVDKGEAHVDVELSPVSAELKEVTLEKENWEKHYRTFEKYFLGSGSNSWRCKIKNPDVIFLRYDRENQVLTAEADQPIEVENAALGYKIHYLLDKFQLDEKAGTIKVFGIPRFEDLPPASNRQQHYWQRQRYISYKGSLRHFLRSLLTRTLAANNFRIFKQPGDIELNEKDLFENMTTNRMSYKGILRVVYQGESRGVQLPQGQISRLPEYHPGISRRCHHDLWQRLLRSGRKPSIERLYGME